MFTVLRMAAPVKDGKLIKGFSRRGEAVPILLARKELRRVVK